ncbi:5111_t:CDS:2 [Dentiscutata erythropus]|uniref:5111_t:CDS:1 n=1 Tax=Dentiscutata erythropus TaxID=1348616 RepID=A0A9N8WLW1_9GLOM|nr:5111_t:CDS:2 [Dentiscutata erythropus]
MDMAIADIALYFWVTAKVALQEGQHKILNNAIQIDPKCVNTGNNSFSELNTFNCTPVSTLCNLTSDFCSQASIKCLSSLYNVNGNILNTSNIFIPPEKIASLYNVSIPASSDQLGKLEWLISGQYDSNPSTKYNRVHANTTRAVSYGIFEMNKELSIALKAASFNRSSMFFAQEAERQLILEIGGMLASVAVGNVEQSLEKVSLDGYIGKYDKEINSNGHRVVVQTVIAEIITGADRIVYDAIRAPSCRTCFNSIVFQHQLLSQDQAGIGLRVLSHQLRTL